MHGQNRELVDELVSLSTKYGILTPYTSFLADERVMLHASVANSASARESLVELEQQVTGRAGVAQRRSSKTYAGRPSSEAAPALLVTDDFAAGGTRATHSPDRRNSVGRRIGREARRFAMKSRAGAAASGPQSGMMARHGRDAMGTGPRHGQRIRTTARRARPPPRVRQIGSKTFYWKNERWIDSTVTQEEDEKATVLTQLSDDYFSLARTQKAENNQYLSLDEPVTVKLEGKVYRIEPAKKETTR